MLPSGSTTWSRFQRQAWVQNEAAKVAAWQASPEWLPATGTVKVELDAVVAAEPVLDPVRWW